MSLFKQEKEKITALQILKETRELFVNTHWTTGHIYVNVNGKKKFCMVGGLCHIFAQHEIPEWLEGEDQSFYANTALRGDYGFGLEVEDYSSILEAEWELARTINPQLAKNASPLRVEDEIVGWNDGEASKQFRRRGNASYVIEKMDETIARVEAQQHAASS